MSKFVFNMNNFITLEECNGFIKLAEDLGFGEAPIMVRGEGEVLNKDIRNNERVVWDNNQVATQLFELVKPYVPEDIDGWKPYGLNERLRFYKYSNGQSFKPHLDGAFKRSKDEISFITLLIYLNDDFEGGETFLITNNQVIKPETGALLLFDHKIMHTGIAVTSGIKYVMRSDVMYRKEENINY